MGRAIDFLMVMEQEWLDAHPLYSVLWGDQAGS